MYALRDFFRNITKGEIIISCIALIVWSTLCVFINMAISNGVAKSNEEYYRAIQISEDAELFEYAMRTDAGDALVYGTVSSVDSVSDEHLNGNYLAIKISIDKYEQKVRYEDIKDADGDVVGKRPVYYKEWDHYKTIESHSNTVCFLGKEFSYDTLSINNYQSLSLDSSTVKDEYANSISLNKYYPDGRLSHSVGDLRYTYYVIPIEQDITVFANLRNGNMYNVSNESASVTVHYGQNIEEVMSSMESGKNLPNILFSIFWYILFIVLACVFVNARNRWADC